MRYVTSYGADQQHESTSFSLALLLATERLGVDLVLGGFLHFQEEVAYFGQRVLPLVRELENAERPLRATA